MHFYTDPVSVWWIHTAIAHIDTHSSSCYQPLHAYFTIIYFLSHSVQSNAGGTDNHTINFTSNKRSR